VVPTGVIKFIFQGTLAGSEVFAHGFQGTATGAVANQAALNALLTNVVGKWQTNFLTTACKLIFPTTVVWQQCTAYFYNGATTAAMTALQAITGGAGTAASSGVPNQCALVATHLTGLPGRSNRGRTYLPGPAVGLLAAGQLGTASTTTVANAYAAFMSAILHDATAPVNPVVASNKHGTSQAITSIRVDTKCDVQRRRANKQVLVGASTATVS
jgi:hypothetical protein